MIKKLITHKSYNGSNKIYLLNGDYKHHVNDVDTLQLGHKLNLWGNWGDVEDVPVDKNIKEGISFFMRSGFQFQANPLDKLVCTQKFGERPDFYKQWQMIGHNGIDFRTKFDDSLDGKRPVFAVLNGIVSKVVNITGQSGYGKYVKLKHEKDRETLYAHLDTINVLKGQSINAGDQIGVSNNTGIGNAPHLHFEFKPTKEEVDSKNGYKGSIDPINLFLGEIEFLS
ncbi:MAG: M23 family metallopeptidase [bacterium]